MEFNKELEGPINYSGNLIIVMIEIIVITLLLYLFYSYYYKMIKNYLVKKDVPKLKNRYIRKLNNLLQSVSNSDVELREAYYQLSKVIREFINKTTDINVLNLSKNEVKKLGIASLTMLMEEYYPPEFAKYSEGDVISSIKRTILLIESWY